MSPHDISPSPRAPLGPDGLGPGAWDAPVRHFCESAHEDGPEVWSAVSSLFITLIALVGLFRGRHNNSLSKLCYAVLAWCGVGSFSFHWTLAEAWSFFDTFPMTIAAVLGIYLAVLATIRAILGRSTTAAQASRYVRR
jgi:apolipoprotein N-acyltransferase